MTLRENYNTELTRWNVSYIFPNGDWRLERYDEIVRPNGEMSHMYLRQAYWLQPLLPRQRHSGWRGRAGNSRWKPQIWTLPHRTATNEVPSATITADTISVVAAQINFQLVNVVISLQSCTDMLPAVTLNAKLSTRISRNKPKVDS